MSRYFVLLLLISVSFSCTDIAFDGQDYNQDVITHAQSKAVFRECQDFPNDTQVSIALIEKGVIRFYGVKRENDTIVSVDNHKSVFEIGSISKVFTGTLLADLVIEGKVELGDPINDYLGVTLKDHHEITFQQLANHTSGLPRIPSNYRLLEIDFSNPYKDYDEIKLLEYLTDHLTLDNPGGFKYSNLGVGLLGYTLTKIADESYEDLLQSRIFSKYGMTGSTSNRNRVGNMLVAGLNPKGVVTPNWDINILEAAGGILSSVSDLSKFAMAQFVESDEVLALTRESTYGGYHMGGAIAGIGLGWMIRDVEGQDWYWHNGGTGGYSSFMQLDVQNRDAVIILSNVSAFNSKRVNIDSMGARLMHSLRKNDMQVPENQ